jgi:electron transfer flavoprotein beta subunit
VSDIAVLLSIGRHPVSGRARRAEADARALELALSLARAAPGARVHAVHAGNPQEPALGDYLGMGIGTLSVLTLPPDADPVPALAAHLAALKPSLVLAGQGAEAGEDSGLVPYLIAEELGAALVPGVVGISLADGQASVLQGLPRGRRRALEAAFPLVATVSPLAPPPRMSAYGLARRGRIVALAASAPRDDERLAWTPRPARKRPKRLKVMKAASAADRVRAVTEMAAGKGRVLQGLAPEAAAEAVFAYLVEEGIVQVETKG